MKSARCLGVLLLALLVGGCAGLPMPRRDADCVTIGPYGSICLLPPENLPATRARHLVSINRNGQSNTFLGRLRIGNDALRLAGASLFGAHLFTITWNGRAIVSRPQGRDMHPRMIIAMLQVALANPALLKPHLYGMELKITRRDGTELRRLLERGHLVARIEIHGSRPAAAQFDIQVPPVKLELHLEPLRESP